MFFKKYEAIYTLITFFFLFLRVNSSDTTNQYELNNNQRDAGQKRSDLDNEFKLFEEKLRRLRLLMEEEKAKQATQVSNPDQKESKQEGNQAQSPINQGTQSQSREPLLWFQSTDNLQAVKNNIEENMFKMMDVFNPVKFMLTPGSMLLPYKALADATQMFIPEPMRFNGNILKTTEKVSKYLFDDMTRMMEKLPDTIELMINSLNTYKINGTETAKNESIDLFSKLSRNLFAWSVMVAQTDLMATAALSLVSRSTLHILKATPLPTEALKLNIALSSLTGHLSNTLPITIKVLNSGLSDDPAIISNNLNVLKKNIEATNKAMESLKNQTSSFQSLMDRTPTTSNIFESVVYDEFEKSIYQILETSFKFPDKIPMVISMMFRRNDYLLRFLSTLSQTFMENGMGMKVPDNIKDMSKKLLQVINVKEYMTFLNSTGPTGKAAINLLTKLQNLFVELMKPENMFSMRPFIKAVDECIEAILALRSSGVYIPVPLLEPLLILMEVMTKFRKQMNFY